MDNRMAYLKGYKACEAFLLHSVEVDNPYKKGSDEWLHWKRGYNDCYHGE